MTKPQENLPEEVPSEKWKLNLSLSLSTQQQYALQHRACKLKVLTGPNILNSLLRVAHKYLSKKKRYTHF